jgi:hypothetical protein
MTIYEKVQVERSGSSDNNPNHSITVRRVSVAFYGLRDEKESVLANPRSQRLLSINQSVEHPMGTNSTDSARDFPYKTLDRIAATGTTNNALNIDAFINAFT